MENQVSAQKALQGFTTETRELLEGTKENSILHDEWRKSKQKEKRCWWADLAVPKRSEMSE